MAKKAYLGVNDKAQKIKKGYVGVSGRARKIKKAYIGIGGKARPCWAGGELVYYGTAAPFDSGGNQMASGAIGDYAVFAGGYGHNGGAGVDAYTSELIHSRPYSLSEARACPTGASVGDYLLVAGGYYASSTRNQVDTYDTELVHGIATALSNSVASPLNGMVENHAVFAGGWVYNSGNPIMQKQVDAYDETLTKQAITPLNSGVSGLGGVANMDGYVIIAYKKVANVYDSDLARSAVEVLSVEREEAYGAKVGRKAIFAGGCNGNTVYATAEVYDETFTRTSIDGLSFARYRISCTSIDDFAIFTGGGINASGKEHSSFGHVTSTNVVDVYDTELTRSLQTPLSVGRWYGGAQTIGNYALIASGTNTSVYSNDVDVYTIV